MIPPFKYFLHNIHIICKYLSSKIHNVLSETLKAPLHNVEIYRSQVCNVTAMWVSFDLCPLCLRASLWIHIIWELWENHIHTLWQNDRNTLIICLPIWAFDFAFPQSLLLTSVCLLVSFAQHVFCCYFANSCISLIFVMEV